MESQIPVQPVPVACQLAQMPAPDGHNMIVLSMSTPVGTSVYFLDAASARALGEKLQQMGAAGDIVLPGPRLEVVK